MVHACEAALRGPAGPRLAQADEFLRDVSWDSTFSRMAALLDAATAPVHPLRSRVASATAGI
jgi:hypothetical protein